MEKIIVIINEEIKKENTSEILKGYLCLNRNCLRKKRGSKNIFIYEPAFNDFRKTSSIISNIKKDLKEDGYTKFEILA